MLFHLLFILILVNSSSSFLQPTPTCSTCPACQSSNGCSTSESTTDSSDGSSTTLEYYQQYWQSQGWKTDDDGNVYVGDDNAKLLLISIGSYCPAAICKGWFGIL